MQWRGELGKPYGGMVQTIFKQRTGRCWDDLERLIQKLLENPALRRPEREC